MKYLCLISAERVMEQMAPEEAARHFAEYGEFTAQVRGSGHFLDANRLLPPAQATTLRVRNGQVLLTDGPYVETKEQLGGYYLIEARDLNEAIRVAARIPGASIGCVEVRPVAEDEATRRVLGADAAAALSISPAAVRPEDEAAGAAQAEKTMSDAGAEQKWLQSLLGEWRWEATVRMPDGTQAQSEGLERVRALGEHWIVCEGEGEMPGCGPAHTLMTLGHDARQGAFVGTWLGSMMSHLWIYRGALDSGGRVLTLDTEGPDMAGGDALVRYQDIIEVIDAERRTLASQTLGADGRWQRFMSASYRRVS